jgi:hypothetical protein
MKLVNQIAGIYGAAVDPSVPRISTVQSVDKQIYIAGETIFLSVLFIDQNNRPVNPQAVNSSSLNFFYDIQDSHGNFIVDQT